MRLDAVGENWLERGVAHTNLAPAPILHTQIAYTLARVVMAATRLGVFDALEDQPVAAAEVARRCSTDPRATEKLLFALAGAGYAQAGDGGYALTARSRKWLRRDSPDSVADKLLLQFLEWEWMERSEDYVRTGRPFELHQALPADEWALYQRGMRAMAAPFASEFVRRLRVPDSPKTMLDIGGSHGYFAVLLCRRHEGLHAVVLDLPEAVEHAAPLLAAEGMGDRVVHRAGNALSDDLGVEAYDIVITAQLVHHFSDEQNRALAARVARALKPGGIYAIIDAFRPANPNDAGQLGALMEFYFALTSQSGTWTVQELAGWQRDAGLRPGRPMRFRMTPGAGAQVATKPS